jgi:hypothetical protein
LGFFLKTVQNVDNVYECRDVKYSERARLVSDTNFRYALANRIQRFPIVGRSPTLHKIKLMPRLAASRRGKSAQIIKSARPEFD